MGMARTDGVRRGRNGVKRVGREGGMAASLVIAMPCKWWVVGALLFALMWRIGGERRRGVSCSLS